MLHLRHLTTSSGLPALVIMAKVLPEAKEGIGYFPCETKRCPHIHGNWSGYCAECTRKSWLLPPGSLKRLKIAGRKARLLFITLVMSYLETEDKVLPAVFGGSIVLVCFFYCLARRQWAALVLVIAACASLALSIVGVPKKCRALSRRLIGKEIGFRGFVQDIEEVDSIAKKFESTVADLVAGRAPDELGPAATVESDERQPIKAADPCSRDAFLEIYATARSLKGAFEEEVLKVLAKGCEFSSNVKRVVRARQKTATKYVRPEMKKVWPEWRRGDYARLRDVLRGSIICGDVEEFSACSEGLKALETAGVVDIVSIKNRLRRKDQAGNGPAEGGYVDVNVIVRFRGFLAEVQLHLAPIVKIKKEAHVAYEVGRGLGLMGALGEADGAMMRPRAVHNVARVVPLMMCLFFGILYFDAFVLKGAPLLVERVTTLPAKGVLLRLYGIVLAAPYFAISYMLVRATGAFGTKARPPKTRIALLYEENFGYEGKYFAWKVAVFQLCEVALQIIAKFPM